jgi:hypothetical protein
MDWTAQPMKQSVGLWQHATCSGLYCWSTAVVFAWACPSRLLQYAPELLFLFVPGACRLFGRRETVDEMRRRVSEFSRWLRNRPEQLVVAFGHSTFWKYFANSKTKMRNCEVLQLWW